MIVTACPATVIVAVRELPVPFAFTENDQEPGPVRVAPLAVIHEGKPLAPHEHVESVVTVRLPFNPASGARTLVGVTL